MSGTAGLSAEILAAVLEQLPSGVVVVDRRGRPILTNHVARKLLGKAVNGSRLLTDVAVSAGMREARSGRLLSHESTPLSRALRGELVAPEEYILARGEHDAPVHLRVSGIPLRDRDGRICGAASVFDDVTADSSQAKRTARLFEVEQRARAETEQALAQLERELLERHRAEEALHGSQQRLRLALEASHMGTWEYDVAGDRIEYSPEMAAVIGAPLKSMTGSLADGLATLHPDDRLTVRLAIREALEQGKELQVEARVLQQDVSGRVRWLLAKGRVYADEQGRPLRMTGIAMDITERKEAEAARQTLAHGERLRALGEMASGIAHDLNQSLALITGYSDMARQELHVDVPDLGRVREMVEITARAALEGGQALRGLLSFVRTQEMLAEAERVELADVLRDVARLTAPRWRDAPQAEGRPINLEMEADPGCAIQGSAAALREAITNLIFNAVDALPGGGTIRLAAHCEGERTVIEVSDTGTGIPPDVQARVFDPFFTTKGERGTGLGLAQVLAIVERYGGEIELRSAPDSGTTFRLKFPAPKEPVARPGETPEKPMPAPQRSIRILVVEDEAQLARMAGLVLTQRGHHVVVAASGEEAIERLGHEAFELIISDLGLGAGKNGWDLAREARERWPGVRFVLVTGWGAAIDPREALARGVDEVIAKPYRIAELRQIADRVAADMDPE